MVKKNKKKDLVRSKGFKEAYFALGVIVGLILLFFLAYTIFGKVGKVEYEGLVFTREKLGDIPLYRYTYHFDTKDKGIVTFNLFLRNDPSKNDVPVKGEIEFPKGKHVYLTLNTTGLTECNTSRIAIASLASFISHNEFTLKTGVVDEIEANNSNLQHVTCEKFPENPVIILQTGEKTRIIKSDLCYNIEVNNCEVLEAVEKFEVQSILDAKKRG